MHTVLPSISPIQESEKIVSFLKKTFSKQRINHGVIGISGGIDSAVTLLLVSKAIPPQNIFPLHLYNYIPNKDEVDLIASAAHIPKQNLHYISINKSVKGFQKILHTQDKIRLGNIMSRTRMICLFDFAKKSNALVLGTENKTEQLLGYYTRFGDAASDIEPIQHLYKTQVYQLAPYLKVPQQIIHKKPTAGLWENQTDEGEFGFTYEEADQVLYLYFDKKMSSDELIKIGFPNALKILSYSEKNKFKLDTPYHI